MSKDFRLLRSRCSRLLASVLVVASLLGNGLVIAQSQPMPAKHGDCAGMMAKSDHGDCCNHHRKPCPAPGSGCDDQCMFRCQSAAAIALTVLIVPANDRAQSAIAPLSTSERPPALLARGLRPPISA